MGRQKVVFVTSSAYKKEENAVFSKYCSLTDGTRVGDLFEFDIRAVPIKELLEVDLRVLVSDEVTKAYSQIKVPCIVEHAGLVFEEYKEFMYPGGLTKPMWDTLGMNFVKETKSAGRKVTACAVVAYCDGQEVKTFLGETSGNLVDEPRGSREFYWDTVFVPETNQPEAKEKTYAEIVSSSRLGLKYKMEHLSQSSKAMRKFLDYVKKNPGNRLWPAGA